MKDILLDILTCLLVLALWALLELNFYGEIQPRTVDTIIGGFLTVSLNLNRRFLEKELK